MVRYVVLILFLLPVHFILAQTTHVIISDDTTFAYSDKDFELIKAANEGDTSKLIAFLEIGADVNTTTYDGVTPLMYAAQSGHLRTVEILIDSGAKINLKPYNMIDALLGACIAGHVVVADTLILNGADVNTVDMNGVSPLMYAAAFEYVVMADMLMFYNTNINAADYSGNTALHYSSFYNNKQICKQLIGQQANLNAADADGFTPLMIAAQNGYLELIELFLENGADINKTNIYNLDALSLAIIGRHEHVVKYLLDKGIQIDHRITDKLNQYDLAGLYGNKQTIEILKQSGLKPLMKTWIDKLYINPAITFNTQDILMGVHTGILDSKTGIQLELGYKIRPWSRSVLYEVNENTYYQFWEKRSVAHIGIDKNFNLKDLSYFENLGLFAGINFGYTFGSFRGSNKNPDDMFVLVPKAGMFYNYKSFNLRVNYEYMKHKSSSVSPHFVSVSMGIMINLVKNRIRLKAEPVL